MKNINLASLFLLLFCGILFTDVSAQNNPNGRSRTDSSRTNKNWNKNNTNRGMDSSKIDNNRKRIGSDTTMHKGSTNRKTNSGNK